MKAPHGFNAIAQAFGDPRDYLGGDGTMSIEEARQWEARLGLVHVAFPEPLQLAYGRPGQLAHGMRCHPVVSDVFRNTFAQLSREGLWRELKTFGGGFVVRQQRGSADKWSTHSWGIAVDFDVLNNKLGEQPRMHLAVVQVFEANGFLWGGWWRRPDGMHFQFATGY